MPLAPPLLAARALTKQLFSVSSIISAFILFPMMTRRIDQLDSVFTLCSKNVAPDLTRQNNHGRSASEMISQAVGTTPANLPL
ncbi:unnamed protein product [Toxocara canis]|uniref:Secreted protein n=1 Tax=Toxocara canis TaxID=6265 RepID=A0A183UR82_TOXCA|nr:unnamed protein product [Toxocara canis]